jgi:hypothetical protein
MSSAKQRKKEAQENNDPSWKEILDANQVHHDVYAQYARFPRNTVLPSLTTRKSREQEVLYLSFNNTWIWLVFGWFLVFNATFKNISVISWLPVLLAEETRVPRVNHRPVASNWQTWSHNVVSSTSRHERGSNSQLQLW